STGSSRKGTGGPLPRSSARRSTRSFSPRAPRCRSTTWSPWQPGRDPRLIHSGVCELCACSRASPDPTLRVMSSHVRNETMGALAQGPADAETRRLFETIDAMDAAALAARFTPDGSFRFGNAEPAVGREAIQEAVGG